MIETEKKYKLDKAKYDKLFEALESWLEDEYKEENILYNIASPNVLRLRKIRGLLGNNIVATFKGQATVNGNGIKSRQEVEFSTQSSSVFDFIEALNYRKQLVYEKNRLDFECKNAVISLDELPFGYYMEIEGTEEAIYELEGFFTNTLGLSLDVEKYSYPDLTQIYGKTVNGVVEARFS